MVHKFVKITAAEAEQIGTFECAPREFCNAKAAPLTDGNYAINVLQINDISRCMGIDLSGRQEYSEEEIQALIPEEPLNELDI